MHGNICQKAQHNLLHFLFKKKKYCLGSHSPELKSAKHLLHPIFIYLISNENIYS